MTGEPSGHPPPGTPPPGVSTTARHTDYSTVPAGTRMGAPLGEPTGTPLGEPTGTPLGEPTGTPLGEPTGTPLGGSASPPAGDPQVTVEDSVGTIFGKLTADVSTLVRQEIALARAEVTHDVKHAARGAGMFAGAGVAGHFTLLFISVAAWWGLGYLVGNAWSALIVAAVWAIVALILAMVGKKEMKEPDGLPRTAETVSKIPNALKGHQEIS